jgi:class 3 adenylate cyclase
MALFGAPVAQEDHAVRACHAALHMQEILSQHSAAARQSLGVSLLIRIGLNSGEVVVRAIGSDYHTDYTAVGQTTHLAARMEQLAKPGSVLVTAETLKLAEGHVRAKPLGQMVIKGLKTCRRSPRAASHASWVARPSSSCSTAPAIGPRPATARS